MKTPTIGVRKVAGDWLAFFAIGHQQFDILPIQGDKQSEASARWQAEMLRSAFGIPRIGDVPENVDDINAAAQKSKLPDGVVTRRSHQPAVLGSALSMCKAGRDGECFHSLCPQLKDDEPLKSGRSCPLPHWSQDDEW